MTPKGKNLCDQVIELQKLKYDKTQKGKPRRGSDKLFEETFSSLFYTYKDKLLNDIAYDLLVHIINKISVKTRSSIGYKFLNFYCKTAQRDAETYRLVSKNINGPTWKIIQRI